MMRAMSDEDLLAVYRADPDDLMTRAAVLRECGRRDRLATEAAERERVRAEWHLLAYSDYLAAEAMCRGELVNRIGIRAGVRDGFALWSGPRRIAAGMGLAWAGRRPPAQARHNHPARRVGGEWLCRTCPSGPYAEVVPSGCRTICQFHRCMQTSW
jgi:hypothetical protein